MDFFSTMRVPEEVWLLNMASICYAIALLWSYKDLIVYHVKFIAKLWFLLFYF